MEPKFKMNQEVFAIPNTAGWSSFNWFGFYTICKISEVPHHYEYSEIHKTHIPVKETRFVYYGKHFAGELELEYIFNNKDEFIEFVKNYDFPKNSEII